MINKLIKLASHLDKKGYRKEADYLDSVIRKMADGTSQWSRYTDYKESNKPAAVRRKDPNLTQQVSELSQLNEDTSEALNPVVYYKITQPVGQLYVALVNNHYYSFEVESRRWYRGCDKEDLTSPVRSDKPMLCFEINFAQNSKPTTWNKLDEKPAEITEWSEPEQENPAKDKSYKLENW